MEINDIGIDYQTAKAAAVKPIIRSLIKTTLHYGCVVKIIATRVSGSDLTKTGEIVRVNAFFNNIIKGLAVFRRYPKYLLPQKHTTD
ncbi:MAG: hypothetical protein ACI358_07875 [Candidatus Limimorpha sp.]